MSAHDSSFNSALIQQLSPEFKNITLLHSCPHFYLYKASNWFHQENQASEFVLSEKNILSKASAPILVLTSPAITRKTSSKYMTEDEIFNSSIATTTSTSTTTGGCGDHLIKSHITFTSSPTHLQQHSSVLVKVPTSLNDLHVHEKLAKDYEIGKRFDSDAEHFIKYLACMKYKKGSCIVMEASNNVLYTPLVNVIGKLTIKQELQIGIQLAEGKRFF